MLTTLSKKMEDIVPNSAKLPNFEGFSRLTLNERFEKLRALGLLTERDIDDLTQHGSANLDLAETCIENALGYFKLPLGVATHFVIDGKSYVIPMAVEETSIVAGLSKTAKWIKQHGEITTKIEGRGIIGQIQLANVQDIHRFSSTIQSHKTLLIEDANKHVAHNMVKRGGGVLDMVVREIQRPDDGYMAVIHVIADTCDAMGANLINQVLEYLKAPIEALTGETVSMCILSNLNDKRLTHARVVLQGIDDVSGMRLQEASIFAEQDPYRATTHNKGVMNGIDPVVIATGNDWRAIEAGVHAYAARDGQYRAISRWRYDAGVLTGELIAPLVVGTVGGVTTIHPTAQMSLRMMQITSAAELSRVLAAVGLVQNLAAMKALCTDGINMGHMTLHITNLLRAAGATKAEMDTLKAPLQAAFKKTRRIASTDIRLMLDMLRHPLVDEIV